MYFILLILLGIGAYVTYTLNLWGPMLRMANAAGEQALEVGKERLREFLESSNTDRRPKLSTNGSDSISLRTLDSRGAKTLTPDEDDLDDM